MRALRMLYRSELKVLPLMAKDCSIQRLVTKKYRPRLKSKSDGGEWKSLGQNRDVTVAVCDMRIRRFVWRTMERSKDVGD